jgi:hypothetical protein
MVVSPACSLLVGMAFVLTLEALGLRWPLIHWELDAWYMPLIWWPGLVFGFFLPREKGHLAACFVWIPGLLWLANALPFDGTTGRALNELLRPRHADCGSTECLGALIIAYPFLNSITYSIGAAVGLLTGPDRTPEEPFTDYTTIKLR